MLDLLSQPQWGGIGAIAAIVSAVVAIRQIRQYYKKPSDGSIPAQANKADSLSLADSFLAVFKAHDIEPAQIPRYIQHLKLADLTGAEKLIAALSYELIADTCKQFKIEQDWLEGKDVPIYFRHIFYKHLRGYIDFLTKLKSKHKHIRGYAIKCHEDKLKKDGPDLPIVMLFEASIDGWEQSDGEPVWSYYIIGEPYPWWYWKSRYHLKAMTYIAYRFGIFTAGCQMRKDDVERLIAGKAFPGPLLKDLSHVAWHPMDYIFTDGESAAAQDHGEALAVREKMGDELCQYLKDRVVAISRADGGKKQA